MKKHTISLVALALLITICAMTGCRKSKPVDNTPAPQGLYLGIVGFNSDLYTMPLGLLNQETKHNFVDFVDGLSMQNGTILYHAVNTGLNSLAAAKIPENLINVSVVTFTDGLDQGSYVLSDSYNSGSEYLAAVNSRINNELIGGTNISAYSIGVRGSDVSDIEGFRNNLKKLSSDPVNNVFEVNNMSEASEKFAQIAQQLYNQSTFYNVTLRLPAQEPNTKIRFTFDNVNAAENSQIYIEGTYIRTNGKGQLTDIRYVGLECMSGVAVTASSEGIFDVFSFRNLTDLNGVQMTTDYVKQWIWIVSAEKWQYNSEFTPAGNTAIARSEGIFDVFAFKNLTDLDGNQIVTNYVKQWSLIPSSMQWQYNSEFTPSGNTEIVDEYKSAMIMLVLDCSSSLGNDFANMKTAVNQFIETLSGNYNGK